MHKHYVPSLT